MIDRRPSAATGSKSRLYDCFRPWVKRLALLVLLPGLIAATDPTDPLETARLQERMLERLTLRWMEGEAASVLAAVRDSLPGVTPTARLRNLEGLALATLGRHREAISAYEAGLRQRLDLPELHLNLAISLEALGATGRAMTEFEEAARLDPGSLEARLGLGRALTRFRRFDRAGQELAEARRVAPDDPRLLRALAELAEATGDLVGAREAWLALEAEAPSAETARHLAEATPASDPGERLRWYARAAARDPDDTAAAAAAGALALQTGDPDGARGWLEPVVESGQGTDADLHNLLLALQAVGDRGGLEATVAAHPPAWGASWGVLALARRADGDAPGALEAAAEARRRAPDDLDLANLEAVCLDDVGRTDEAIQRWEWVLDRDPDHREARGNLEARRD